MQTGTYLLTHSSTKRYIHFYDAAGASFDKYQWKILANGTLKLDYEGNDHWFSLAQRTTEDDNTCDAANDCTGGLPKFCKICSDGSTACAHWACDDGTCAIASCE